MLKSTILFLSLLASPVVNAKKPCDPQPPTSFVFKKGEKDLKHYVDQRQTLALSMQCITSDNALAEIKKSLQNQVKFRKTSGNIDYFDIFESSVLSRTYLVPHENSLIQFSFITEAENIRSLNHTEQIITAWVKDNKAASTK